MRGIRIQRRPRAAGDGRLSHLHWIRSCAQRICDTLAFGRCAQRGFVQHCTNAQDVLQKSEQNQRLVVCTTVHLYSASSRDGVLRASPIRCTAREIGCEGARGGVLRGLLKNPRKNSYLRTKQRTFIRVRSALGKANEINGLAHCTQNRAFCTLAQHFFATFSLS